MSETRFRLHGDAEAAAESHGAGGRVLDFRRGRIQPRRRKRSLAFKLLKPLVLAALAVTMPLSLGAWTIHSSRFALADVAIAGTGERVPRAWVERAVGPFVGRNLVQLPLSQVEARLEKNPWIAASEITKELPHRLVVHITEKKPAIVLEASGELYYADAEGKPIAPVATAAELVEARRQGLLTLSFAATAPASAEGVATALAVGAELKRAHPQWMQGLARIDVLGEEDFRFHTTSLPCPVLVARGRIADKLVRLERLLPEIAARYPAGLAAIDLRFAQRIVLQPNLSKHPTEGAKPPGVFS